MTRASFLITLWLSAAVAAQPALPLPGTQPPPPLPLPAEKKADEKKPEKKSDAKNARKEAAPAPLPLPGLDAAPAKPADKSADKGALPLPGTEAAKPLPLPGTTQPAPASTAQKPPPAPAPAATAVPATTTAQKPPAATPASAPSASARSFKADPAKPPAVQPGAGSAPVSAQAVQLGDVRLRPDFNSNLWNVRGFIGGERSAEGAYTDANTTYHTGAEVMRWFSGTWLVRGELDWRSSNQSYVPLHSTNNVPVKVDENRFDVLASIGYDVGPKLVQSGRLELTPMIGVAYTAIRNDAFPADLLGPDISGRVRWSLSPAVIAHTTIGYTFNLASSSTQNSALKAPKGDLGIRAGLSLPLAGGYALDLDYVGDVLAFENTFRTAHGAALGFGTTF